jgi:hypothetical protein
MGKFETIRIVAFSTGAAIAYGILHDQVTAHLCVEYFTIAHPPIFGTESPFLLALGWGIVATWWVGLLLGVGLAAAARAGAWPKFGLVEVQSPVVKLMIASAIVAFLSGLLGAYLVASGRAPVPGDWGAIIAPDKHVAFSADAWAHAASYACGAIGGLFLMARTLQLRRSLAQRGRF